MRTFVIGDIHGGFKALLQFTSVPLKSGRFKNQINLVH